MGISMYGVSGKSHEWNLKYSREGTLFSKKSVYIWEHK